MWVERIVFQDLFSVFHEDTSRLILPRPMVGLLTWNTIRRQIGICWAARREQLYRTEAGGLTLTPEKTNRILLYNAVQ